MNMQNLDKLPKFLEKLGIDEEPMGLFYTDQKPAEGLSPKPMALPTREKEINNDFLVIVMEYRERYDEYGSTDVQFKDGLNVFSDI